MLVTIMLIVLTALTYGKALMKIVTKAEWVPTSETDVGNKNIYIEPGSNVTPFQAVMVMGKLEPSPLVTVRVRGPQN